MQSHSAKEAEAEGYQKSAKKRLQKSLFHKPNYADAAEDLEKAARIYTHMNNYTMARDTWTQASEARSNAGDYALAASSLEKFADFASQYLAESSDPIMGGGAAVSRTDNVLQDALHAYEEASKLYGVGTNGSKQAAALKKAADMIARRLTTAQQRRPGPQAAADPEDATLLQKEYQRLLPEVISLMERNWEATESKPFELPELYRSLIRFHLRAGDVEGAVQVEKRLIGIVSTSPADGAYDDSKNVFRILNQPTNAAKAGLEIIVLCLSTSVDDGYTWATIEMGRLGAVFGFCGSAEERAAAALLAAYADRDEAALQEALKSNACFSFIAVDISRLAKKLTLGAHGHVRDGGVSTKAAGAQAGGQSTPPPPPKPARAEDSLSDVDDLR